MNKFLKQVVNSVAVQAAAYAVTEGSKVVWPKAKKVWKKMVEKTNEGVSTAKNKAEFATVIKNTEKEYKRQVAEKQQTKATIPTPPVPSKAQVTPQQAPSTKNVDDKSNLSNKTMTLGQAAVELKNVMVDRINDAVDAQFKQ